MPITIEYQVLCCFYRQEFLIRGTESSWGGTVKALNERSEIIEYRHYTQSSVPCQFGGVGGGGGGWGRGGGIDHVLNIGVEVEGGGVFKKIFLCSPYASHGHD